MASDSDKIQEFLIESLSPRLETFITVEPVLKYLHFIQAEQQEQIRQKLITDGDMSAARLLINLVIRTPHQEGWFRAFVDALYHGGSEFAAKYLESDPPIKEVEEENDSCVRLIQILAPSLEEMKTEDVCVHCFQHEILTDDDREKILAETRNKGSRSGAAELLRRIVKRPPGWYSTFLQVLCETEHKHLYKELTGGPPECEEGSKENHPSLNGEAGGGEAAAGEAAAEKSPESMEICVAEEPQDDCTDLYKSADQPEKMDTSDPDLNDLGAATAATRSPDKTEIVLRDYQMEVARPALEGKNIIICLPTGSGKTRVAVYITKKHLDSRREEGKPGKVIVLVNKIPLVEQHYATEFSPYLKPTYNVERVSGDSQLKISFAKIVQRNDILICTAQILENYLERANSGEDEGVKLSDLTLIIIDECHHTQKGGVYNHIMMRYLKQKHRNMNLKKEGKDPVPLPQILGLTASPGVGKASLMAKAVEHIMRICANLDATRIMTWSFEGNRKKPRKQTMSAEDKTEDPFGDVIKTVMTAIHDHAKFFPTCDLGSQNYEQWAVQKERQAAKEENQKERVCAEYLRRYNDGLILSNTIRMCDALRCLKKFHEEQMKKKTSVDDEQHIQITATERFLFSLFKDNKEELERLAKIPKYENDSLAKLRTKILQEFSTRKEARGIIFTKTRNSAITLSQWIQENPKFADIGVKPSHVIGGGDQSDVKPMTAAEQKDVLKKFRTGEVNVLVATTVAEEGLDIPACNFVIRYGLSTNEIAMIQAQGRGRAEDSSYTVVDIKNSGVAEKECVNEHREDMMNKAIEKIKTFSQVEYNKQITEFQMQAMLEMKVKHKMQKQKAVKDESPSAVKFSCRGCSKGICSGENINIIENMHRVNVTPEFKELVILRENTTLQERLLDYEVNGVIACKDCGQTWGSMMMYRGIECPCLNVKNFVVDIRGKKISDCTTWSDLPVKFSSFDYAYYASLMVQSSDDED